MNTYVQVLTVVHVIISLVAIVTGFAVLAGMLKSQRLQQMTSIFLATTVLTNATGFLFPFKKFLPSHGLAIISLVVLAVSYYALYSRKLSGAWRGTYVGTAIFALYVNVFVLIVQAFLKVPFLHELAPKQNEPPFAIAQGVALLAFMVAGVLAAKRFRPI